MKKVLLILFTGIISTCILMILSCTNAEVADKKVGIATVTDTKEKTLLVIFAHPDDESTIAPILSKYVREGIKVHLVIATDGRLGTNDFSGLAAGDGLAAIRRGEMQCAADALGVELHHLEYHDQLKAGEGYDGHMPHAQALIKEVHQLVSDLQPDVLLTFGPDGGSNHLDHRLIGATTTAVFLSKKWEQPTALYYVGTPASLIEMDAAKLLRGVADHYLTTQVTYTDEDFEKAITSMLCHASQFQSEGLRARMEQRRKERNSTIYFRKFIAPSKKSNSVFE